MMAIMILIIFVGMVAGPIRFILRLKRGEPLPQMILDIVSVA